MTLIDTGLNTMTGGRIKRIKDYVDDTFLLTYGDGVGNVNIKESIDFHINGSQLVTVTSVQPKGRFGNLDIDSEGNVKSFLEKPQDSNNWINAGFFVCDKQSIDYIDGDDTSWEKEPLELIAKAGQLNAFKHYGFWKPMDTLRDNKDLNNLWAAGNAPWKIWK